MDELEGILPVGISCDDYEFLITDVLLLLLFLFVINLLSRNRNFFFT